jgi:hypothetical protein
MLAETVSAAALDRLLIDWYDWDAAQFQVRGFSPKALVCGDFRCSRQYDDENGALDALVDRLTIAAVDRQIQVMQQPHRTAIAIQARNLSTGSKVWKSSRLPDDPAECKAVVREARNMLMERLLTMGIL